MGQKHPQKLVLSRETVRDLTKDELLGIQGGGQTDHGKTCPGGYTDYTTVDSGPPWPCPICCI